MIPRIRWVSFAVLVLLTVASACLAAGGEPSYKPGKGAVGGLVGGSFFGADQIFGSHWFGDYSIGAAPRSAFSGQVRYVMSKHWRWQTATGFTWSAYKHRTDIPFTDPGNPQDTRKDEMITLRAPSTLQMQYVLRRGQWFYHAGAGPGLYRIIVENHRHVLQDPLSLRLHRGLYAGGTFELGAERFLKAITTTSIELSWANHLALSDRNDQFQSGFNSNLMAMEWRIGVNYYFDPLHQKTQDLPIPGSK